MANSFSRFRFRDKVVDPLIVIFLLLFLVIVYFTPVYSSAPPQLRVGISLLGSHVEISFDSSYSLVNIASGAPVQLPAGRYRLTNEQGNIRVTDINHNSFGVFSGPLLLSPLSSQPSEQSFQLHNGRYGTEFRGALEIAPEGGSVRAVNIIDFESYLRGVVPREMPASWGSYGGMEALKAQAVAARSYALFNQGQQRHSGYHVCDTQHCQVYGGKSSEHPNTDRALNETRGQVLTFDGRVIQPFYHATNGGYTELAQNVWTGAVPYVQSVPDPYDDPSNPLGLSNFIVHRYSVWEMDVPLKTLGSLLASKGFRHPGEVQLVSIASSYPSGRVAELQIQGTGGTVSLFRQNARTALDLRSQLFTVRSEPEPRVWIASAVNGIERIDSYSELEGKWAASGHTMQRMLIGESFSVLGNGTRSEVPYTAVVFDGLGWGHGIGMSQNGAYNRSRAGHSYNEILSFYYPGTQITSGY